MSIFGVRPVFQKVIYSLGNHPGEWVDNHRPKGRILEHKSGILIYGGDMARIMEPSEILPNPIEKILLRRAVTKSISSISNDGDEGLVIATMEGGSM